MPCTLQLTITLVTYQHRIVIDHDKNFLKSERFDHDHVWDYNIVSLDKDNSGLSIVTIIVFVEVVLYRRRRYIRTIIYQLYP